MSKMSRVHTDRMVWKVGGLDLTSLFSIVTSSSVSVFLVKSMQRQKVQLNIQKFI